MSFTCPKCSTVIHANNGGFQTHLRYCGRDYRPVFWSRVKKTDGCWVWTGALQRDGYAHFTLDRKTITAHRYAYEITVGPIPAGMDLLHSCDNRACVNPAHLRPGTHEENIAEMVRKGRNTKGEQNRRNKVTADRVREIRKHREETGETYNAIGDLYGISPTQARAICLRVHWRHIT